MEKYKICPTCGTKNPPTIIECIKCETDLTGVPIGSVIVNEDTVEHNESREVVNQNNSLKMMRICECGMKNPASARKCSECGEDISDIIPTQCLDESEQEKMHFILSSIDGVYAYELIANLTIIGRENTMKEYLASKAFVSRKHAELLVEAEKLWLKDCSTTNHTYVNNEVVSADKYIELQDGDVIGFGGKEVNGLMQDEAAYFRVRIGTCI